MLGLFKKKNKETFEVQTNTSWDDEWVGMAGDSYIREIRKGDTGVAVVVGEHVTVTFDDIQDVPYNKPLKIYFKLNSFMETRFDWGLKLK